MNVWVRIIPTLDASDVHKTERASKSRYEFELNTGLALTVYRTKEAAMVALRACGGILLEVAASSLRGVSRGVRDNDVLLVDGPDWEEEGPTDAFVSVSFADLPYEMVPNYGGFEPGTVEPQGDIAEFGPEAVRFFEALEKETGFELHQ